MHILTSASCIDTYLVIKALGTPHSGALIALHAFHKFSLGVNKLTTRRHRGMDTEIT